MPRMLWPGCWALWAALAAVDDIADSGTRHPAERAVELQAWVSALDAELAAGTSTDMVRRALVDTIMRWRLDVADLQVAAAAGVSVSALDLAEGAARDLPGPPSRLLPGPRLLRRQGGATGDVAEAVLCV